MQDHTDTTMYGTTGGGQAASTADTAKDTASHAAQEAKNTAASLADKAKEQMKSQVSSQKDRAAERLDNITQALHETSDHLQEKGQENVGGVLDTAASQVDRLTGYLRNKDVDDLLSDLERAARRNPAMFVGGAFVAGLVLARFLKSSPPETGYQPGHYQDRAATGSAGTADYRAGVGAGYAAGTAAGTAETYGRPGTYGTADVPGTAAGDFGTSGVDVTDAAGVTAAGITESPGTTPGTGFPRETAGTSEAMDLDEEEADVTIGLRRSAMP